MLLLKELAYEYILLHDNLSKEQKLQVGLFVKEASEEQVISLLLTGECKESLDETEGKVVREIFTSTQLGSFVTEASVGDIVQKGGLAIARGDAAKWMRTLASKYASFKVPTTDVTIGGIKTGFKGTADLGAWNHAYGEALKAIQQGTPIAAGIMAALVILVGRKIYKSYLSKAARACKGKATPLLKNECIRKFKLDAVKAELSLLASNKQACTSTKNPDKCKAKIDKRMLKSKSRINKIMTQKKSR